MLLGRGEHGAHGPSSLCQHSSGWTGRPGQLSRRSSCAGTLPAPRVRTEVCGVGEGSCSARTPGAGGAGGATWLGVRETNLTCPAGENPPHACASDCHWSHAFGLPVPPSCPYCHPPVPMGPSLHSFSRAGCGYVTITFLWRASSPAPISVPVRARGAWVPMFVQEVSLLGSRGVHIPISVPVRGWQGSQVLVSVRGVPLLRCRGGCLCPRIPWGTEGVRVPISLLLREYPQHDLCPH